MNFVLTCYLLLCMILFFGAVADIVYEDVVVGPDHKFGYNYKNRYAWLYVIGVSVPFVNIALCIFGLYCIYYGKKQNKIKFSLEE